MNKHSVGRLFLALFGGLMLTAVSTTVISSSPGSVQTEPPEPLVNHLHTPNVPVSLERSPLPPPDYYHSTCAQDSTLCLNIYTGTIRSTYIISNPGGVYGLDDYDLANFRQRLLSQSPIVIEIEVTTHRYLDTRAPYPVNTGALPSDVQPYLLPDPGWIQSDNPQIVAKAQELVSSATRQAEAVDAIVAWVRSNISYEVGHDNDASSVFDNRAGVCAGFSSLTAALLRAADIPAKYHVGCVTKWGDGWGWVVGDEGGRHAWNELYYPDVGWTALDPQVTTNYLDAGHIHITGFGWCQQEGTVIARTSHRADNGYLYCLRTPYVNHTGQGLWVASVPAWDRHPLKIFSSPGIMLPITNPVGNLALRVENLSCSGQDWRIKTEAPWLTPTVVTGSSAGTARFTVDASGMHMGFYTSPMTLYSTSSQWWWMAISRTVTANLWLVDEVHRVYLPATTRGN